MRKSSQPRTEANFRAFFQAAGVAIAVLDAEGMIVESNQALVEMLGYSEKELRQMTFRHLAHRHDRAAWTKNFGRLIAGRASRYQMEALLRRRDGQVIRGKVTVTTVIDSREGEKLAVGVVENLSPSRELLEASVRAAETAVWDWDLRTNKVYYSPQWKRQLGYQDEEISDRVEEWRKRLHPADRQSALTAVERYLKNSRPEYEIEWRLRHKDGTYRWFRSCASLVRDADGRPLRMSGAHVDITQRKLSEERLREYQGAFEGLQEMVVVLDRDYRCLLANRAFLVYRFVEREKVVGHPISEFLDDEFFRTVAKAKIDECFRGEVVIYQANYSYPEGADRQLFITNLPIEGPEGVDRVACVMEDITDRRQLRWELLATLQELGVQSGERTRAERKVHVLAQRLLVAQEEERRAMARELHDDLNQELAGLSLSLASLKRSMAGEETGMQARIDGIHKKLEHVAERIRHMARRLHPAVLEYAGIAAALESYGAEFAALNGIRIVVEASGEFDDVPAPVGLCLYRVAQAALQNVAKHSGAKKATVRIERDKNSDLVTLTVADSGVGFHYSAGSAEYGLGLVSMKERVRLVNGELNIVSARGKGTTVRASVHLTMSELR